MYSLIETAKGYGFESYCYPPVLFNELPNNDNGSPVFWGVGPATDNRFVTDSRWTIQARIQSFIV